MGYTESVVFTWVIYILEFILILWRLFTKNEKKKKTPVILLVLLMFISAGACISTRGGVLYAWQNTIPFLADPSGPEPFGPTVVMGYVLLVPIVLLNVGILLYLAIAALAGFLDELGKLFGINNGSSSEEFPKEQKRSDPAPITTIWTPEGTQPLFYDTGVQYRYRDKDGVEHHLRKGLDGVLRDDITGRYYEEQDNGDWM